MILQSSGATKNERYLRGYRVKWWKLLPEWTSHIFTYIITKQKKGCFCVKLMFQLHNSPNSFGLGNKFENLKFGLGSVVLESKQYHITWLHYKLFCSAGKIWLHVSVVLSTNPYLQVKCKPGVLLREALDKGMKMRGLTPETCLICHCQSRCGNYNAFRENTTLKMINGFLLSTICTLLSEIFKKWSLQVRNEFPFSLLSVLWNLDFVKFGLC